MSVNQQQQQQAAATPFQQQQQQSTIGSAMTPQPMSNKADSNADEPISGTDQAPAMDSIISAEDQQQQPPIDKQITPGENETNKLELTTESQDLNNESMKSVSNSMNTSHESLEAVNNANNTASNNNNNQNSAPLSVKTLNSDQQDDWYM